jgi:hypothetical protein
MKVTAKFAPKEIRMNIFRKDDSAFVDKSYDLYTESKQINLLGLVTDAMSEEDILEEVFDLTNNPSRQDEREERYGNWKSVSVGDVVEIRAVPYICESFGWRKLDTKRLTAKSSATMVWVEVC